MRLPLEFHDVAEVEALAETLTLSDPSLRRIAVISGAPASGRRHLVRAAAALARDEGHNVLLAMIDLDGYEPDMVSAGAFLDYQRSKYEREPGRAAERLATLIDETAPGSAEAFALLAAAIGRDAASDALADRAIDCLRPEGVDWDRLGAAGEVVILHLADALETPLPLRTRLADLGLESESLRLAVSCDPGDGTDKAVRRRSAARFEVMPLDDGEIRSLLDGCELGISAAGVEALTAASHGSRALLALHAARILETGEEPDWSSLAAERWSLAAACQGLEADERKTLEAFLVLAALAGENAPVKTLLTYLGVGPEEIDDWIDRIDEAAGADSDLGLFAERFQHPSFPGETVYGFAHAAHAEALRQAVPAESRKRMAAGLVAWLLSHVPVETRAVARLCQQLCRHAGADHDRMEFERELAFWAGEADIPALRQALEEEVRAPGGWNGSHLWATANLAQLRWPAGRTLAVLDAAAAAGLPPDLLGPFFAIRAGLLLDLEKWREAADAARTGIAQNLNDKLVESALHERLAAAQRRLGEQGEATESAQRSLALRQELLDQGDRRVVPILTQYAAALRQSGRADEAAGLEAKLAALEKR